MEAGRMVGQERQWWQAVAELQLRATLQLPGIMALLAQARLPDNSAQAHLESVLVLVE